MAQTLPVTRAATSELRSIVTYQPTPISLVKAKLASWQGIALLANQLTHRRLLLVSHCRYTVTGKSRRLTRPAKCLADFPLAGGERSELRAACGDAGRRWRT